MRSVIFFVLSACSLLGQTLVTGQHGVLSLNGLSTGTFTWPSATTSNNLRVVYVSYQATTDKLTNAAAVHSGGGANYTKMSGVCGFKTDGTFFSTNGFYLQNATSDTTVVVTADSGTFSNAAMLVGEYSGVATSTPFDQCNANTGTANTTTDGMTSGAVTAVTGALVTGFLRNYASNGVAAAGTGYTSVDATVTGNCGCNTEYKVGSGSQTATFTGAGSSFSYIAVIATFKPSGAGTTGVKHRGSIL